MNVDRFQPYHMTPRFRAERIVESLGKVGRPLAHRSADAQPTRACHATTGRRWLYSAVATSMDRQVYKCHYPNAQVLTCRGTRARARRSAFAHSRARWHTF